MDWKKNADIIIAVVAALVVWFWGGHNWASTAIGGVLAYLAVQKFYPPSKG